MLGGFSKCGLSSPRVILSGLTVIVFLWSGLAKIGDPISFAAAVAGYRLTGPWGTLVVAAALPAIEIICAIGLCAPRWRRAAVTVLLAACGAFLIALAQAWARGLDIHCGCFGERGGTSQYPYWVGRDIILLGTLAWLRQGAARAGIGCQDAREPMLVGWADHGLSKAVLILVLGAASGLAVDAFHPRGVLWSEVEHRNAAGVKKATLDERPTAAPSRQVQGEVLDIDMEDLRDLLKTDGAILIDARARVFWRLGHLPGALSLPHDDFARGFAEVRPRVVGVSEPRKSIIVYCHGGDCHDGELVAGRLVTQGIDHVRLFRGGWEAWEIAGMQKE